LVHKLPAWKLPWELPGAVKGTRNAKGAEHTKGTESRNGTENVKGKEGGKDTVLHLLPPPASEVMAEVEIAEDEQQMAARGSREEGTETNMPAAVIKAEKAVKQAVTVSMKAGAVATSMKEAKKTAAACAGAKEGCDKAKKKELTAEKERLKLKEKKEKNAQAAASLMKAAAAAITKKSEEGCSSSCWGHAASQKDQEEKTDGGEREVEAESEEGEQNASDRSVDEGNSKGNVANS